MKSYVSVNADDLFSGATVLNISHPKDHVIHLRHGEIADSVVIPLSGKLVYSLSEKREFSLMSGQLCYFAKGMKRSVRYAEDTRHLTIHFNLVKDVFQNDCGVLSVSALPPLAQNAVRTLCEIETRRLGNAEILSCLYALLDIFVGGENDVPQKYRVIHQIKLRLEDEFASEHRISEYAAEYGISAGSLRRLFTEYVGVPPVTYRLNLRLTYMKHLLDSGLCNFTEAAYSAGFNHIPYACRAYKKKFASTKSTVPKQETP